MAWGFVAVIAFVLLLTLAQGIGQSVGQGMVEWLVR